MLISAEPNPPFTSASFGTFNEPWAMTFLPDGRLLVTEKAGQLRLFNTATKTTGTITGVPAVAYGGQGGFGDVVLHPQFASNRYVYLSYAEAGANSTRASRVCAPQSPPESTEGLFFHRPIRPRRSRGGARAWPPVANGARIGPRL